MEVLLNNGLVFDYSIVNALVTSLIQLEDDNIMYLDDGSRINALKKTKEQIIEIINQIRKEEPRACSIDEASVLHTDKRGRNFYQARAKGKQIKRVNYTDFLIEMCKIYFPGEDIPIRTSSIKKSSIPTIRNIGDKWLADMGKRLNNNRRGLSFENYRFLKAKYNKYIKNSPIADKDVRKFTVQDCVDFLLYLTPVDEDGKPQTSQSVFDGICSCLSHIFYAAKIQGYTEVIDIIEIKKSMQVNKLIVVKPKEKTKIWSMEEWSKIEAECQKRDTELSRLIEVKVATITRSSETTAFKPDILDFDEGLIDIYRSMQNQKCDDGKARPVLVNHTKGKLVIDENHERLVPFDVNGRIGQILKEQAEKHPDGFLFQNSAGSPFSEKQLCEGLKSICEAANVPYYRPHTTRFLGISLLKKAGMKSYEIRKLTGHNNDDMPEYYDESDRLEQIIPKERRKEIISALNVNGALSK